MLVCTWAGGPAAETLTYALLCDSLNRSMKPSRRCDIRHNSAKLSMFTDHEVLQNWRQPARDELGELAEAPPLGIVWRRSHRICDVLSDRLLRRMSMLLGRCSQDSGNLSTLLCCGRCAHGGDARGAAVDAEPNWSMPESLFPVGTLTTSYGFVFATTGG